MSEFQPINFWLWLEANRCEPSCSCGGRGYRESSAGTTEAGTERLRRTACGSAERRYKDQVFVDRMQWERISEELTPAEPGGGS